MAHTVFHGEPVDLAGDLPLPGVMAPPFLLAGSDLSDVRLRDFAGRKVVLNIFPSIDTPVCAMSVRRFNKAASEVADTVVLCVSADLPFAHQRFCETEGLKDVIPLSVFRSPGFGRSYGVTMMSGPLAGLLARAIVIVDPGGRVAYTELVGDISREPDYGAALRALAEGGS